MIDWHVIRLHRALATRKKELAVCEAIEARHVQTAQQRIGVVIDRLKREGWKS